MSLYTHITQHCIQPQNQTNVEALVQRLSAYEACLADSGDAQADPILKLCSAAHDLPEIEEVAATIRAGFSHVIVCGAGGSGLSGRVLSSLRPYAHTPSVYTLENMDPTAMEALMAHCPPERTFVVAISKSGSTVETLSQFYALHAYFVSVLGAAKAREHFLLITMEGDSPMRHAVHEHGLQMMAHPKNIGGRFSLFTAVGLLPAALVGVDIHALRRGAATVAQSLGKGVHAARLGAALQYDAMERGCNMSVMLPYCERLAGFSAWYRQSWAESLGKGGKGTTPISAVGTTDQHSQLQLYLDGPQDKFFTMIMHKRAGTGQPISAPALAGLEYLQGRTTGDVMEAEQKATLETLVLKGCPVRVIHVDALNEEVLGALVMHFMLEIFFMAHLLEVNAFDQPAVEQGKHLAREYLHSQNL